MEVIKRCGKSESVDFNKITNRLNTLKTKGVTELTTDSIIIAKKVIDGIHDKITTHELDVLASEISIAMATEKTDYATLASRIVVSDLHKQTPEFRESLKLLKEAKLVSDDYYTVAMKNIVKVESIIDYDRDYLLDFFGCKTLTNAYLLKVNDKTVERPQSLWMRVSLAIHGDDFEKVEETYNLMSLLYCTHATPTLFNAGTPKPQMSSCFLMAMKDDSIDGIYSTLKDAAQISKWAGGIGLHIHNIRATGSSVNGVEKACTGIVPMLRNFNMTARYVNQGGKRNGSIAIYLQVDHADVFKFLDLRKNTGDEEERCRDLFTGMWIPDLFMEKVKNDEEFCLFCPYESPGLSDVYGEEYNELYKKYENEGMYKEKVSAQKLWFAICQAQIETGGPYILFKDACNEKSNQKNLGTIKCSNLCTEILEYTSPDETAVCNLASIALPKFIKDGTFDFRTLGHCVEVLTNNLNLIIDKNFYPIPEAKTSNMKHRPIGIGVQGLADVYQILGLAFDSPAARELNKDIFETIYYYACYASMEAAKLHGAYESFKGSPISKGLFQFDLWNVSPSDRYDWDSLRSNIITNGVRNSLLVAPMPTASTSQILGNNECFEPYTSNLYVRRTMAGEFVIVNKNLTMHLERLNMWDVDMKNEIIKNNGSIQSIQKISKETKNIFKTAWELSQKELINQAADRGAYVCQSQSLNLFIAHPTVKQLSSMHFYSFSKGLKTGLYYLRTKPVADAQKFTIECSSCSA
jgi:ribonucleoside-diphosphate reductase alpha chain